MALGSGRGVRGVSAPKWTEPAVVREGCPVCQEPHEQLKFKTTYCEMRCGTLCALAPSADDA